MQGIVGDDRGKPVEPGDCGKVDPVEIFVLLCGPRWKRRPNVSDERFWGSIGGRLERFWGRWRRYGAAEGQGGVEPEKYKYKDKYKDGDMGQPKVKGGSNLPPLGQFVKRGKSFP